MNAARPACKNPWTQGKRRLRTPTRSIPPIANIAPTFVVRALSQTSTRGFVTVGQYRWPCALGRSGRHVIKRESDGATPVGHWALVEVFYRPGLRPRTGLPVRVLRPVDGWCDAPSDRNYNRAVRLPYRGSAEALWRDDGVYDIIVVLGHNQRPRRRGMGSAIFMHLARPGYPPTQGCIALAARDLRQLVTLAGRHSRISVGP